MFIPLILLVSLTTQVLANVSCGSQQAATCAQCPAGNNGASCGGDCTWINNQCTLRMPTIQNPYACDSTGKCRARTATVQLTTTLPQVATAIYRDIVPRNASNTTYFSILSHDHGHGGLQMNKGSKTVGDRVVCSIWDQATPTTVKTCGQGVKCLSLTGSKTGRTASWPFQWKLRTKYAMVHTRKLVGSKMEHECWFYSPDLAMTTGKGWKHLATFLSDPQGRSPVFSNVGSYVEQWLPVNGQVPRVAQFGPMWFRAATKTTWTQANLAIYSPICPSDEVDSGKLTCSLLSANPEGNRVVLSTGGMKYVTQSEMNARGFGLPNEKTPLALVSWTKK